MNKIIIFLCAAALRLYGSAQSGVGINTTNPQATLHVNGNGKFDSIPQVPAMDYVAGYDTNGFMLKISIDQIKQQKVFPDIVGLGMHIMTIGAHTKPLSFYKDSEDKLLFNNQWIYLQVDSTLPPQSRDVSLDWPINGSLILLRGGAAIMGTYAYILVENSTTGERRVYRYNKLNLSAGGTYMTTVGQNLGNVTPGGLRIVMACDGTALYFTYQGGNSNSDNIISKYTISGTSLLFVSNITRGAIDDFSQSLLIDNAGNYYAISASGNNFLKKFSSTGALMYSWRGAQYYFMNWSNTFYSIRNGAFEVYEKFNK